MEIVTGDQPPILERTEAERLLREMAAVVRTIFGVDVAGQPVQAVQQEQHLTTAGAGGVPGSGGAAPAPAVVPAPPAAPPVATPAPATPPASIPVPGVAILQEIAFLDD